MGAPSGRRLASEMEASSGVMRAVYFVEVVSHPGRSTKSLRRHRVKEEDPEHKGVRDRRVLRPYDLSLSLLQLLDDRREHFLLFGGADAEAEVEGRNEAGVALLELVGELVVRSDYGELLEHVIRHRVRHFAPLAFHREAEELDADVLPAVDFEHREVSAGGGVEGELLTNGALRFLDLPFVLAGDDEGAADDVDVG